MNIPSIPTDNLYKFMAIFGLVVCLFCEYQISVTWNELELEQLQTSLEYIETLKLESKKADQVTNDHIEVLTNAVMRKIKSMDPNLMYDDPEKWAKSIDTATFSNEDVKRVDSTLKSYDSIGNVSNYYEKQIGILNLKFDQYRSNARKLIWAQWLGLLLVLYGFKLWYSKHQKYADAERKWKGEVFVALSKDEEAKKKAIQDELDKVKAEAEKESDSKV